MSGGVFDEDFSQKPEARDNSTRINGLALPVNGIPLTVKRTYTSWLIIAQRNMRFLQLEHRIVPKQNKF